MQAPGRGRGGDSTGPDAWMIITIVFLLIIGYVLWSNTNSNKRVDEGRMACMPQREWDEGFSKNKKKRRGPSTETFGFSDVRRLAAQAVSPISKLVSPEHFPNPPPKQPTTLGETLLKNIKDVTERGVALLAPNSKKTESFLEGDGRINGAITRLVDVTKQAIVNLRKDPKPPPGVEGMVSNTERNRKNLQLMRTARKPTPTPVVQQHRQNFTSRTQSNQHPTRTQPSPQTTNKKQAANGGRLLSRWGA